VRLPELAAELADAGLTRVNVSLDTLRRERFLALTRRDELDRVIAGIDAVFPIESEGAVGHVEPAARHRYRDGDGDVGVIPSVTEPFCDNCDRVRLTAEGRFRTCLFALEETDLRTALRADGSAVSVDDRVADAIVAAVGTKWAGHRIGQVDFVRPDRSMSQIGG